MIARIRGSVEQADEQRVTLTPEGAPAISLDVLVPTFTATRLAAQLGTAVQLSTKLVIEAPSQGSIMTPRLIGFLTQDDRAFFELFTTVKGIGPRKALRAMAVSTGTIAAWIADRDAKSLTSLPEIGKRGAETIVAELSGKVDAFVSPASPANSTSALEAKPTPATTHAATALQGNPAQAALALVRLGESNADAERKVKAAIERDPTLQTSSPDAILAAAFTA